MKNLNSINANVENKIVEHILDIEGSSFFDKHFMNNVIVQIVQFFIKNNYSD